MTLLITRWIKDIYWITYWIVGRPRSMFYQCANVYSYKVWNGEHSQM